MCGLVGVLTKKMNGFSKDQQDIFSTLLFVDTLRGKDSTGLFVVNNEGDVYVAKDEGMAPNFMQSKEYEEAMRRAWSRGSAIIGHNRAATRGKVNDENAHPFNVDNNIILVHNGTMRSDHKKHADVEVDSHAIAHLIQNKASVSEALGSFYGAYALIWYDVTKGEVNMIRNDERPLFWMELDDAWVWCSEKSMLEFAANRVNANVKTEPTSLPPDMLQTFTLDNRTWRAKAEKVEIKKQVFQHGGGVNYMGNRNFPAGRGETYYEDFDWDGYQSGMADQERPPFRRSSQADLAQQARDRRWDSEVANHPTHGFPGGTRSGEHSVIQLLPAPKEPRPQQQQADNARRVVEAREPVEFAGVEERERQLAVKQNKIINHGHYANIVLQSHPFNVSVHCAPFDYAYANGKDPSDGYYLYASPFDDEDIILRQWFSSKGVTEERMIQLAGCDYVFEFTLNQRRWYPVDPKAMETNNIAADCPGYTVIRCTGAKMISSGLESKIPH